MRRAAAALLALAVLAGAGCGSDGGAGSATELLKRGFATDVDSGLLKLDAELELEGIDELDGPLRLRLEGPFQAAGSPTDVPDMDVDFRASGAGQEATGRVVLTRENAWIEFRGATYEVGEELWARLRQAIEEQDQGQPQTFGEAGVDPLGWIEDAEEDGEAEVAGAPTAKVSASLDLEQMVGDFAKLTEGSEDPVPAGAVDRVDDYVDEVDFEAWIGEDDIWRRVRSGVEFEVPEEERDAAGGLEGGSASLEIELSEPNEPVQIEGPAEARPIEELLRQLGIPPELLLGPGFAPSLPG
ncbi:MAG: hypothetical protein ACRDLD_14165 [Thermoleophilaceae bacterium]